MTIIGKLSFDRHEILARPVLERMLDAGAPVGARGVYMAPGIALGWCSGVAAPAVDAAVAGDELHQVRVVADASLTNARELRAALERLDHTFGGTSDAELMAHAYQEWGDRCIERFRGPFACAIWDERQRRLLLARDHVGIKPLFFALLHGHGVVFASDTRALLQDPGVGRDWCPVAVDAYLALGYVPAPLTVYRRISKLEASQRLVIDGRRLHVEQYWDLPSTERGWEDGAEAERVASDISAELERTLRHAMRRDAGEPPIDGTLFSGGVASAALLASAAGRAGEVITAIDGCDIDETTQGLDVARRLDYDVHVEAPIADAATGAKGLAALLDEPIADPRALAQFAGCTAASRWVSSAFAGHGARELWALGPGGSELDVRRQVRAWTGARGAQDRRAIYTRTFAWEVRDANPFARHLELYASRDGADPLERALYVRARTFLPDSTLALASRASGAGSLAPAFPFLDRTALDLAARVPAALKRGDDMRLVRGIIERRLGAAVPSTPNAATPPRWLRDATAALVPTLLLSPRFDGRGIVSRPALRRLWDEHVAGRRDHSFRFWSLLMLELWLREHIDGDAAEEPLEYAILQAA